ncbi:NAD(P)H-binding protein [Nocardia colli]|uniref:NAD(P)H-binding protein n=1 Tax=Nocardia colli TaxID=2545717 RepID=A0A5N0EDP7_9NOCA|nr:NAD(P)H-binding protein [Nocardia colli]KAA8887538.1 NAD(P)H-binding protein [Nocardia colli]
MILITGGRGAVATQLLSLLHADGRAVRVGSGRPDKLQLPAEVAGVACDLTDPSTFPAALAGVSSVFLYAEAAAIGEFVSAATEAGVEHIVLLSSSSVLDPDADANPVAKSHLDAERGLADAPMTVSVLRPGAFAGNARSWAWSIKAGTPINLPYPNAYVDPIHEIDVATAAYALLTKPEHRGETHNLTGPETLTFTEQIDLVADITGRAIAVEQVTPEAWKEQMADYMPAKYADGLLDYWRRTDGVPNQLTDTVSILTGRAPRTFASWVEENAAEFTG